MIIVANNVSGDELKRTVATINASPVMKDRVRVLPGIKLSERGTGMAASVARHFAEITFN
jgi:hypothetical protein